MNNNNYNDNNKIIMMTPMIKSRLWLELAGRRMDEWEVELKLNNNKNNNKKIK